MSGDASAVADPVGGIGAQVDADLERAVDSIGAGRLLFSIADALAKAMKHPESAARAYAILLARLEGQTLDQIARREGISRERIRQVVRDIRRIVVARPGLFVGFDALEQAVRNEIRDDAERFQSWLERRGSG
ncbi:sigma factor-like helix-turn-helix DNA-binding protein [Mycobacterium avium subsp. hominissuis]|uniref:sigma factor-like helix-turn-helix DNA-binding protein n=1 Tax=Mycobacterium avium TaxID=1764 RepID=UPI0004A09B57|nr:sigma factor-like helix-turn-helix DNA-binding protein [Mycobacterium avium]KDP00256.1 RNA polymerase subunit sigma-70 [Mycobacterium avium subsp. hominissuis 100]MDO2384649.1 sigma factor-like helix-turn-helix DNA-binding protein [Mycobacterium avium subsp. hominissuis]